MRPITEESLEAEGYKRQIFFFQTGGGEDEDDIVIYVKGNRSLYREYVGGYWMVANNDALNYITGWPYEDAPTVQYVEEIETIKL